MGSSDPAWFPARHRFVSEQSWLNFGLIGGLLAFAAASGLAIRLLPFSVFSQTLVLVHTLAAIAAVLLFGVWLLSHWLGTRKAPRRPRKVSAYIGFWLLAACSAAGFVVTAQAIGGLYMSHVWAQGHLWTGILAIPFLVHHLIPGHGAEESQPGRRFMWKWAAGVFAVQLALTAGLAWAAARLQPELPAMHASQGNPFAPSNAATGSGQPLPAAALANSESCGAAGCHTAIYREWRVNAHRWSAEDQFFQTVRSVVTELHGSSVTEKCGACHDPVSLLSGSKNPSLGARAPGYREGDSCVVCHAVERADERGIGSYVLRVPARYLYDGASTPLARQINHFLIRAYPAQHSRDYNLAPVRQAESCAPCHKEYDVILEAQGPVQVETQYDDWKHAQWNTAHDPRKRLHCQQCHMYYLEAPSGNLADPYDLRAGLGRRHRNHFFAAANQFMPEALGSPDAAGQIQRVTDWLHGDRVAPEIEPAWPRGPVMALKIDAPATATRGGSLRLQAVLTNRKAGHGFPTGPLNIVRAWLELTVSDARGREIFHSGHLDEGNHIEAGSYVLKPLAIDLHGAMIQEPDLWHPSGPRYRPAVLPGQSAAYDYEFRVPGDVRGPLAVRARLLYRKANQFFMDSVYPDAHRTARVTDVSSAAAEIQLRGGS